MADIVDIILAEHGLGAEVEASQPASFNSAAEQHRQILIARLEQGKAAIEILIELVANHGDNAEAFAAQARGLSMILDDAGDDVTRFHFSRECRGVC